MRTKTKLLSLISLLGCITLSVAATEQTYYLKGDTVVNEDCSAEKEKSCQIIEKNSSIKPGLYKVGSDKIDEYAYFNIYKGGFDKIANTADIYINKGVNNSLKDALINCSDEACEYIDAQNGGGYITETNKIITCTDNKCVISSKEGYFINLNDEGSNPLIYCKDTKCEETEGAGFYLNALNNKSLIQCSDDGCNEYIPKQDYYYFMDASNSDNALLSCKGGCSQTTITDGYYLTDIGSSDSSNGESETEVLGLISCEASEEPTPTCQSIDSPNEGFYQNAGNTSTYPLISSDSNGLKLIEDVLPGYYVAYIPSEEDPIILVCDDKEKCIKDTEVYSKDNKRGNYAIEGGDLKLVIGSEENNEEDADQYSSVGDGLYYNVEVDSRGFPGINTSLSTVFLVNKKSITRVVSDGILYIDSTTHTIVDGANTNDSIMYNCSKSKKICTESKSCAPNTYLLDSKNNLGYYCNSKRELEALAEEGYYVDSSKVGSIGANAVFKCEMSSSDKNSSDGPSSYLKCTSVSSPKNYYVNAGDDKSTNALIYCSSTYCRTTPITNGYFMSGINEEGSYGIIKCTSSSNCDFISSKSIKKYEHYYINNGIDKSQNALIKCKNKSCSTLASASGFFITNDASVLIDCENETTCVTVNASAGYYNMGIISGYESSKKIIECVALSTIYCELKDATSGYYVTKSSNILINCNGNNCKAMFANNGIYRSATTRVISTKRDNIPEEDENEEVSNKERANSSIVYNIISCTSTGCNELSTSELLTIPVCNFNNNKCFINNKVSISTTTVSAISAGSYCTNSDRSIIYFATDTVVIDPEIIDGTTSIYTYTTTTTNCIEVSNKYNSYYYTVGSSIYRLDDGSIAQHVDTGYYFINVATDTLVTGIKEDDYNNENVKLFRCNGTGCSIMDKPDSFTYYADVNKRIIQYNPNSDSYSYAYENDVICIYANNKCTPRADVKSMEFCITYKGELCLVTGDILSRETGECYKADTISSTTYGLSRYLYTMNAFSAERVTNTANYMISLSTNNTANARDYDARNNSIRIYGCLESKCEIYEPVEGVFYYDNINKYMFRYENDKWHAPESSGYGLVSTEPDDYYINRFTINNGKVKIDGMVKTGYYYTVNNEMYACDQDKYLCEKITDSGYYFTVSGEIYQCLYDSEGLERTECTKKNCIVGQYYFIDNKYYYCSSGYMLNLVSDKTCEYNDKVIINFPVAFSESYPEKIKNAIENINTINNSTAVLSNISSKYIVSVPAIFTNCTYTVEEKESQFDLVCVNNFVSVNDDTDNVEICSISQMGYTECIEDENNPEKCNPSGALSRYSQSFIFAMISIVISSFILFM